jgi:eukaryotic-like serine/threonine-protein kinase
MSDLNLDVVDCDAYRFDRFEVGVRSGTLLFDGQRRRVQPLPLQMLLILLEHPGETVDKQELGRRLWGQETFVEVDKSLYVVAAKLREALGDNADGPRYIRTDSGRGYRFIGNVMPVFGAPPALKSPEISEVAPAANPAPPAPPVTISHVQTRARVHRAIPLALITLIALGAAGWYWNTRHFLIAGHEAVVVGGVANTTGNPDLDGSLSFGLRQKLEQSPYLGLISETDFHSLVKTPDTAPVATQLNACASLGGKLLLTGQLISAGKGYQVQLTARDCANGHSLAIEKALADSQETILSALDVVSKRMRQRLGEPEASLQRFNVPSMQAITPSLAALKAFGLGEEMRSEGLNSNAITCYKLAIDLDPQFALAYARLGITYTNTRQPSLSRQYYRKAFELRNRTSDRGRLYIVTHYYAYTTGEINRAIDDYELWRTLYPRDVVPTNNLAVEYLEIGQPQRAVDLASRAIQLDPRNPFPYAMLVQADLKTGAFANLNPICAKPPQAGSDFVGLHEACFQAAAAQNDEAGMQRQLAWAHGNPEESILLNDAAWIAISHGRLPEAQRLFAAAQSNALAHNLVESAADIELDKAKIEADLGLTREARVDVTHALEQLGPQTAVAEQAFAALTLALTNDLPAAEAQAANATSQAPLDTILNSVELASVRAVVQMAKHDPKAAVDSLEIARPFDFCENMDLSPAYYRGMAYLQNADYGKAVVEFRRVLDHRLLASQSPYVPLSELAMGRAYQLLGDSVNAETAFLDVQVTWQDAVPGFPPVQQLHRYQAELKANHERNG